MRDQRGDHGKEGTGFRALHSSIPATSRPYDSHNLPQSSSPFILQSHSYAHDQPAPSPTVYRYLNPRTGETLTSLLPPSHPEMICLQEGKHKAGKPKWGVVGMLGALICCPCGIALCIADREARCKRCGYLMRRGLSN